MMLKPELLKISTERLQVEDFVTAFSKKVFEKISCVYKEHGKFDIALIEGDFSLDEISRMTKMLSERGRLNCNDEQVLNEYIRVLLSEKQKSTDSDTFESILDAINKRKK